MEKKRIQRAQSKPEVVGVTVHVDEAAAWLSYRKRRPTATPFRERNDHDQSLAEHISAITPLLTADEYTGLAARLVLKDQAGLLIRCAASRLHDTATLGRQIKSALRELAALPLWLKGILITDLEMLPKKTETWHPRGVDVRLDRKKVAGAIELMNEALPSLTSVQPEEAFALFNELLDAQQQVVVSQRLSTYLRSTNYDLPTLEQKQNFVRSLNALLKRLNLCVRCPSCEKPAILRAKQSGNAKAGVFHFEHNIHATDSKTGKSKVTPTHHGGKGSLSGVELNLIAKPPDKRLKRP